MPRTNVDKVATQYRRFNDSIRGEMKRRKVTQAMLAKYLGINQPALSLRMNGENEWSLRDAFKAAEFLEVDIKEIL
jgi:transcriptional regulator with XRE-family HTH domain